MKSSESIAELAAALVAAQSQMRDAPKSAYNPHYDSRYADLAEVWATCRKPLTDNGLCVTQTVADGEHHPSLWTTLIHKSGQWIRSEFPLLGEIGKPQTLGSLITYARRYSLAAIVGIAQDDDDGNAATPAVRAAAKAANDREPGPQGPAVAPPVTRPTNGHGPAVGARPRNPMVDWISDRIRQANDRYAVEWKLRPANRDKDVPVLIKSYYEVQNHFITFLVENEWIDAAAVESGGKRDNAKGLIVLSKWWADDMADSRKQVDAYLKRRLDEATADLDAAADDGVATADADGSEVAR